MTGLAGIVNEGSREGTEASSSQENEYQRTENEAEDAKDRGSIYRSSLTVQRKGNYSRLRFSTPLRCRSSTTEYRRVSTEFSVIFIPAIVRLIDRKR